MSVVRMVKQDDLSGLVNLASTVDGFMTTVPNSAEDMKARIDTAVDSVKRDVSSPGNEIYMFVMEEEGNIIGMSGVYAVVGIDRPFYNYRVTQFSNVSPDVGLRHDINILNLVNDYNGAAEVATLFLNPEKRGGGRGVLLSYARLMFIAAHRHRFPDKALAEIRGWTDNEGRSPFWEAVGEKFFKMDMAIADARSGSEFQFVADLMPKYPIYIDLLPEAAQNVIAKPNESAKGALKLLEKQGFRYQGQVDIFDAGICIDTWVDEIDIVKNTRVVTLAKCDACELLDHKLLNDEKSTKDFALLANASLEGFSVIHHQLIYTDDSKTTVRVTPEALTELNLAVGDSALLYCL